MSDRAAAATTAVPTETTPPPTMPWGAALLLACGNLAVGATSPLYDSYVPPLLERHLASSAMVGVVMGIDNAITLTIAPIVGACSDRTRTRLGRRMPFVLGALPFAAVGLAALPLAAAQGFVPLLGAIVIFNLALTVWRAPFTALVAEMIPSAHRSTVGGLFALTMCLAAMLVLGGGQILARHDARLPFVLSAALVFLVWLMHAAWLREPKHREAGSTAAAPAPAPASPLLALQDVLRAGHGSAARFFIACGFFHIAFQSFSSWFTTHGAARFGVSVADCSTGFIAVAVATLIGSIPAGALGRRVGRRRIALVGMLGMAVSCVLAHTATSLDAALFALAGFGLFWSLPLANLMPMAFELLPPARAGSVAAVLLACQAIAGIIGPAMVGTVFDVIGTKRPLFLLLAGSLLIALLLLGSLEKGFGETQKP